MATFTNTWSETIPTNSEHFGQGATRIRQTKLDMRERMLKFSPVGLIRMWMSDVIPDGWMECDGSSLSRTTYATLFALLGTGYGTEDGTHFNIPDLRGYFVRGWNHSRATGLYDPDAASRVKPIKSGSTISDGDHAGTVQMDDYLLHAHRIPVYVASTSSGYIWTRFKYAPDLYDAVDTDDTGGLESEPQNISVRYIIRVDGIDPTITDPDEDFYYSYMREWNETSPADTDYAGDGALQIRLTKEDAKERIDNLFPIGAIAYWPSITIPYNWIECNGAAISRTDYSELFSILGTMYGYGDNSTTFNIPDLRGLFLRGVNTGVSGSSAGIDENAASRTDRGDGTNGDSVGTFQESDIFEHHHAYASVTLNPYISYKLKDHMSNLVGYDNDETADSDTYPLRGVDGRPANMSLMTIIKVLSE